MKYGTDYNRVLDSALTVLSKGGTLLYPTDTIWGVGCDATDAAAVEKIYAIKRRDHSKSMLVLCEDMAMVESFVGEVGEEASRLLMTAERPTTVILPMSRLLLADNLTASDGTIGVRIPRMEFCQALLHGFAKPIVSTSANLSGRPSPASHDDIEEALMRCVDYCVPGDLWQASCSSSSRIVKIDGSGQVVVIRP